MATRGQHGSKVSRSRRAAELYLDEQIPIAAVAERFGISKGSVWSEVYKVRKERAAVATQ